MPEAFPEEDLLWIAEPLRVLAVPIDSLKPLPGNPRRGVIEVVQAALKEFGQRKPITSKLDGTISAGNHTWRAAKANGKKYIACVAIDDDDERAMAWSLTDNRSHDLGDYDNELLVEALGSITNTELLSATGYDEAAIAALVNSVSPKRETAPEVDPAKKERDPGNPVVQYQIIFSNEDQQQVWYSFVRWLKRTVDGDTLADRLTKFLEEIVPSEDEE